MSRIVLVFRYVLKSRLEPRQVVLGEPAVQFPVFPGGRDGVVDLGGLERDTRVGTPPSVR